MKEEYELVKWEDLFEEEEGKNKVEFRQSLIKIDIVIGQELKIKTVVDTGATHCCINKNLYEDLIERKCVVGELPVSGFKLMVAVGKRFVKVYKQVLIEMEWEHHKYMVIALVAEGLFSSIILGLDWMRENKITIHCGEDVVRKEEGPKGRI